MRVCIMYVCVRMYICMFACPYAFMYVFYVCNICKCSCMYALLCVCIYIYMFNICTYITKYACIYTCILFSLFLLDEKKTKTASKQNIPDTKKQFFFQLLNTAKISTKSFHRPTAVKQL